MPWSITDPQTGRLHPGAETTRRQRSDPGEGDKELVGRRDTRLLLSHERGRPRSPAQAARNRPAAPAHQGLEVPLDHLPPRPHMGACPIHHAPTPRRRNLAMFTEAAASSGHFSVTSDPDGIVRWMPLVIQGGEEVFPPLSVAGCLALSGAAAAHSQGGALRGRRDPDGRAVHPHRRNGQLLINYLGPPKTFPHFSISDILAGHLAQRHVQGQNRARWRDCDRDLRYAEHPPEHRVSWGGNSCHRHRQHPDRRLPHQAQAGRGSTTCSPSSCWWRRSESCSPRMRALCGPRCARRDSLSCILSWRAGCSVQAGRVAQSGLPPVGAVASTTLVLTVYSLR